MFRSLFRALMALARIVIVLVMTPFGVIRRLVAAPPDPVQIAEERAVDREIDVVDQQAELLARQLTEEEARLERERQLEEARREILFNGIGMKPEFEDEPVPDSPERAFTRWATAPAAGGF